MLLRPADVHIKDIFIPETYPEDEKRASVRNVNI